MDIQEMQQECGQDSLDSEWGPMAGFSKYSKKYLHSIEVVQ
jgi:hypothetical protein